VEPGERRRNQEKEDRKGRFQEKEDLRARKPGKKTHLALSVHPSMSSMLDLTIALHS